MTAVNEAIILLVDNILPTNNSFDKYLNACLRHACAAANFATLQIFHISLDDDPDLLLMPANTTIDSPPDLSIGQTSDLLNYELSHFWPHRRKPHP